MLFKRLRKNYVPKNDEGDLIRKRFQDESLCRRCGQCCHQGFIIGKLFVQIPELPCRHLVYDGDGKYHCEVYETRESLDFCNRCDETTVKEGLFPDDCAYVQGVVNYTGKSLPKEENREKLKKAIRRIVKDMSRPDYIRAADWLNFLKTLKDD